jgi:transposase-like protein
VELTHLRETKAALAAIKSEKTLTKLAKLSDVHPCQITAWKAQLQEGAAGDCQLGGLQGVRHRAAVQS